MNGTVEEDIYLSRSHKMITVDRFGVDAEPIYSQ
jgi:hypothetical protein